MDGPQTVMGDVGKLGASSIYAISAQFTSAQKGNYILPIAAALSPRQDFMKVRMKEEIIVRESAFSIRQVFMAKAYHCKHMLMPAAIAYPSECCQLTVYLSFLRNPFLWMFRSSVHLIEMKKRIMVLQR